MKERPIRFTAEMVQALLAGRKTQTRRIVKPQMTNPKIAPLTMEPWLIDGEQETDDDGLPCWVGRHPMYPTGEKWFTCPYGGDGDALYVKETYAFVPATAYRGSGVAQTPNPNDASEVAIYRAGWPLSKPATRWRGERYMPKWVSRIRLQITEVRVERLQEISEQDAEREGVQDSADYSHRDWFSRLWTEINGPESWDANPWVWVITFERL